MSSPSESAPPAILFVDNNEKEAGRYQSALQARGYQIVCVNRGRQALRQMDRRKFAIAVIDTALPDIDGLDLVSEMATLRNGMPIIIHTREPFYANNFRSWAADAVVIKSTNTAELLKKINCLLEEHEESS
jgi:DNA-binding response OmpR family regulator